MLENNIKTRINPIWCYNNFGYTIKITQIRQVSFRNYVLLLVTKKLS